MTAIQENAPQAASERDRVIVFDTTMRAGRLLAVAHGGVEDDDAVALRRGGVLLGGRHGKLSSRIRQAGVGMSPEAPCREGSRSQQRPGAAKAQREEKQAVAMIAHGVWL